MHMGNAGILIQAFKNLPCYRFPSLKEQTQIFIKVGDCGVDFSSLAVEIFGYYLLICK